MLKVIHSADWHLRDMQFGKASRAQDFTDSVFRIVDIAVAEQADYIVCAGDILNSKRPSSRNISDLLRLNQKLRAANIPLLVVTGNHDKCSPTWTGVLQQEMEDNGQCFIFDIDFKKYELIGSKNGVPDGTTYTAYGVPDTAPDEFRDKVASIPKTDILVMHGLIQDFASFAAGERVLYVDDLPTKNHKAIMLGDIHTNKYVVKDDCIVGYPGSTELCSRNEPVEKFVTLFTFADDGNITTDKIQLKLNKPIITEDVKTDEEVDALLARIESLKMENPTILVRKDPKYMDLYIRIARIVNTKECIIRVSNLRSAGFRLLNLNNRRRADPGSKQAEDFISDYFPTTTDTYALSRALCDPSAKVAQLLETFIDDRLYARKNNSTKKFGAS